MWREKYGIILQSQYSQSLKLRFVDLVKSASWAFFAFLSQLPVRVHCGHQFIELGIPGEIVLKGHQRTAAFQQTVAYLHICNITELVVGDVQKLRQFLPIRRCLIQHHQEFGICQHGSRRVALEQIVG